MMEREIERQRTRGPTVYPTRAPDPRAPIRIQVPAELWGELVAAALQHRRFRSNTTRSDLARAAVAFVNEGIGHAKPTDGSGCVRCVERAASEGQGEELPPGDPS